MDCHLHHHLLEVLLDAAEADHPIRIAMEGRDDLPAFLFGTECEYMYIDEIGWTDPNDGKLKGLCEDHKDDVYTLHRTAHEFYDEYGEKVGNEMLSQLSRSRRAISYDVPDSTATKSGEALSHRRLLANQYHSTTSPGPISSEIQNFLLWLEISRFI